MKTSVELNGYIVSIEEENGVISVTATKDDEVVEEFTIQTEGDDSEEDKDVRTFGDYDEEDDFEGSDDDDDDDDFEGSDDDDDDDEMPKMKGNEAALESFQSFINKKSK